MNTIVLPSDLAAALESEREPGEQLLWTGQPKPFSMVKTEWGAFVFGIPWTAFALFWEAVVLHLGFTPSVGTPQPVAWGMALFGLPFIGVGVAMLSSPFVAMAKARNTMYAVTTRRVLFLTRKRGNNETRSFAPQYVGDLKRTERGDGSGDLWLVASPQYGSTTVGQTGFFGIPNVRDVERIVRETFFPGGYSATAAPPSFGVGGYGVGRQ